MRGTAESCFTAYISHTFVDLLGEENGPMGGPVVVGRGVIVCELHVYQNVSAKECDEERRGDSWRIDGVNLS